MAFKRKDTTEKTVSENSAISQEIANNTETPKISTEAVITSFSIVRRGGLWSVATIKTQGDTVVSREFSEPNPKGIVMPNFKMAVGRYFTGLE